MISEDQIEDAELAARREELANTKVLDFRIWLQRRVHQDGADEYADLAELLGGEEFNEDRFLGYDYQVYSFRLMELKREELMETLIHAEADWKMYKASIDSARVALGRGTEMTPVLPIAVVQCGFKETSKDATNLQCEHMSVPGGVRCEKHGGDWLDPRIRQSFLMSAHARLVEASDVAVDALVWVAQNDKVGVARVAAAKEILDRAGITATQEINITVNDETASQTSELRKRLSQVSERLANRDRLEEKMAAEAEANVEDAEVIEETDPPEEVPDVGTEPG
jgi:hypothetical protein